jgi:hypothetical protein
MAGVGHLEARVAVTEACIKKLESTVNGNGQPGLEVKLMTAIGRVEGGLKNHIESVERHTNANMVQGDGDLLNELQEEKEARETQHKENKAEQKEMSKQINRLTYVVAGLNGALLMLKALEDLGVIRWTR